MSRLVMAARYPDPAGTGSGAMGHLPPMPLTSGFAGVLA
jgi:hypothetical protein